jgi:hypothetical protein
MSKNYIEEWMRDNNLEFNINYKFIKGMFVVYGCINTGYCLCRDESKDMSCWSEINWNEIMLGKWEIEKIKPKTLMEQLKEQGYGYLIQVQGEITNVTNSDFAHGVYDKMIMQCNIFLTESEAKREAYRRKLEFEMQEWARENDCLGSFADGVLAFRGLNVYITRDTKIQVDDCQEKFIDKYDKYYNWEEIEDE